MSQFLFTFVFCMNSSFTEHFSPGVTSVVVVDFEGVERVVVGFVSVVREGVTGAPSQMHMQFIQLHVGLFGLQDLLHHASIS